MIGALILLSLGACDTAVDDPLTLNPSDASTDANSGSMCPASPTRIDCRDRIESSITSEWSTGGRAGTVTASSDSIFGDRSLRVEAPDATSVSVRWTPDEPVDIRPAPVAGPNPVLRVAMHAENPNHSGWQRQIPQITIRDANGGSATVIPAAGNRERLPTDQPGWQWLHVPLAGGDGWIRSGDGDLDFARIDQIQLSLQTYGSGFTVQFDGLDFTGAQRRCQYDCPNGCNDRGSCAPDELRCACEFGAVGPNCGACADGFEAGPDGACQLTQTGDYEEWPNPVSDTTGDAWLRANHSSIEVLRPKVLALNFANQSDSSNVQTLVDNIIGGFDLASKPRGYANPDATPQLQYEISKVVDLRNDHAGNPQAPTDWDRENSTLFPRSGPDDMRFDYEALFSEQFADHYGYDDPDGEGHLTLCELVESGRIHDVWMVAAHTDDDATPAEVLEFKQRYTPRGNPIPDSFEPCAGNGCFRKNVSPCGRSVRIGFINYKRGPGCYLHNIGHLMEWTNSHNPVPHFSRWFDTFSGLNLDERYDLPVESLYAVSCEDSPCITYPDEQTIRITHQGETYTIDDWRPVCGNCHFPPNAQSHYNYDNSTTVSTSCRSFGRAPACQPDARQTVTQQTWADYRQQVPDCGGGFLTWWYQNMPARGTDHTFSDGMPMKSVWPHHFY